jgi:hypothetical protein
MNRYITPTIISFFFYPYFYFCYLCKKSMAARFKSTIGLIILIVIGIIGVFYFSVSSAEEDIHMLAERVLQETIIEDYHVRSNTEPIYSRPGGRKIKNYQIETEKGVETFSFKDSIDEYRANQLVTQYLLAEYSPINPDTFMAVFNEKMKEWHNGFNGNCLSI